MKSILNRLFVLYAACIALSLFVGGRHEAQAQQKTSGLTINGLWFIDKGQKAGEGSFIITVNRNRTVMIGSTVMTVTVHGNGTSASGTVTGRWHGRYDPISETVSVKLISKNALDVKIKRTVLDGQINLGDDIREFHSTYHRGTK